MYEFCSAALPWIALGVVLAVYAAFAAARTACACIGFFGGIVFASITGINPGFGMFIGLIAGLLLSGRKSDADANTEAE